VGTAVGPGRETGVNDVDAGFNRLQEGQIGHAGGEMAVKVNGNLDVGFQGFDQVVGIVRGDESGHVLDTDGVSAHVLELLGLLDIIIKVVHRATHAAQGQGVADGALEVLAELLDGFEHRFKIAEIVQRIKGPEHINPIDCSTLDEGLREIVRVIPVAYTILPTEQHHHGGLGQELLEFADAHPRVFVQEAMHGVEGCSPPNLHRPIPHLVHLLGDGQEVLASAAGGEKRLMTITHGQVTNFNRIVNCRGWIIDKLCNQ